MSHVGDRFLDAVVPACVLSRGDCSVHGRSQGAGQLRTRHLDLLAEDVRVDLHQHAVFRQPAAGVKLVHSHAALHEGVHDHPRAKGGGFDQRPIDFFRRRGQRGADQKTAEVVVDQHRPAAVPPVQSEQAGLPRPQRGGFLLQQIVNPDIAALRFLVVLRRHRVAHEPGEDVAHRGLPGFVAEVARQNAILDHTADALNRQPLFVHDHVAGGSAHDECHLAGTVHPRSRHANVRVDHAHRDGGTRQETGELGHLRSQSTRLLADRHHGPT